MKSRLILPRMRCSFLISAGLFLCFSCGTDTRQEPAATPDTTHIITDEFLQLQKDIGSNPDSAKLYDALIDTLANRGRFAEAATWCNKLIGRGADSNYYYWYIKGDLFRRGTMYDSAIASYQTYLRKFPDDEQVLLNLANTYAEAGNGNAIDMAHKIETRYPTREMRREAAFIKGVYYNTIKQYKQAVNWLDTAIVLDYNFSEAYMEKGYAQFDMEAYNAALKTFQQLTALNRTDADAWYWAGKCQEALGNKTEALNSYKEALSLNDSIAEAKQAIDRLSKTTGQP